jgi:hypothetical protein
MGLEDDLKKFFHRGDTKPSDEATPAEPVTPPPAPAATAPTPGGAATQAVNPHRTLLIHGYSATGTEFEAWKAALAANGIDTATIEIGNYITLNNEVTIQDLGEAFDRALRYTKWSTGTRDDAWTFDAVVHSTGMLVVRQWLTSDPFPPSDPRSRIRRLKHLVGLAPATFGSPQGKEGRSWLGALVKGNKDPGPDFMNAGDQVLLGLELASEYTWNLALEDMIVDPPFYDQGNATPYIAVFIGNAGYTGVAALANSPGSDGTVRWGGCALNSRLIQLDFLRQPRLTDDAGKPIRLKISPWADTRLACPILAVEGKNHGTILAAPDADAVQRVSDFLRNVNSDASYGTWLAAAQAHSAAPQAKMDQESVQGVYGGKGWQQFVLHVTDDHGLGVTDYNVQLYVGEDLGQSDDKEFPPVPLIADSYSADASYRCFYVRLDETMLSVGKDGSTKKVWMELIASSGTAYLEYEAYYNLGDEKPENNVATLAPLKQVADPRTAMPNVVKLDLTDLGSDAKLFYPYTTTLVEMTLEREPTPLGDVSQLFQFWQGDQTKNVGGPLP